MVLKKEDIEEQQSSLQVLKADTNELSDDVNELHNEVFSNTFMREYTMHDSFCEFITESPIREISHYSTKPNEFEQFIVKTTVFDDWAEMKTKGAEEWIVSKIGL